MASLRKNFLYNSILTVSSYIFPLMVFPYVTRILGVNNFGICNFVDSIIQYFILFSFLGMQTMATREIAKVKNDPHKLQKTFNSLLFLNIITTVIALIFLVACIFFVDKFQEYKLLLFIGSAKILSNTLLVEWFYVGTENFKYITIRSIVVRLLYILSVFIFVRGSDDYILYFSLTVLMFVVNAIINIVCVKRYTKFSFSRIQSRIFLRSFLILGFYQVLTSMYTSFNVAYLGFVQGEAEVGYYTVAIKIYSILLGFFTAFTSVMLPRMSSLIEHGGINEFKNKISASIDILLCFSMPIISIALVYAPTIVRVVAGDGYEGSILPLQIIVPLMLIIGYEQILVLQVLTPLNKDKSVLVNSIVGALIGLLFNILLVGQLGKLGSAFVWVASEVSVLVMAQFFVYKYLKMPFPIKKFSLYLLGCVPGILVSCIFSYIFGFSFLSMFLSTGVVFCYFYVFYIYIIRNQQAIQLKQVVETWIRNK